MLCINKNTKQLVYVIGEILELTPGKDYREQMLYMFEGVMYCCEKEAFYELFMPFRTPVQFPEGKTDIIYPYETEEFKHFTNNAGILFRVYKNGRVFREYTKGGITTEVKPKQYLSGYYTVSLAGETWLLHRLVATCWIPNTDSTRNTVDHINVNKNDNSVENLQWLSAVENSRKGNKPNN